MHSVQNTIFVPITFEQELSQSETTVEEIYLQLGLPKNEKMRQMVHKTALNHGMVYIQDESGTNIDVKIFDLSKVDPGQQEVMIVMDYAFGHQAYELMDELLKSYEEIKLDVRSISIMGKAGILEGGKGDIMIPTAHIFEGTLDNYVFEN
jgi:hypothetical protein